MDKPYWMLNLRYSWNGTVQYLHPVVLFGERDIVLVDCGCSGSLKLLERELSSRGLGLEKYGCRRYLCFHGGCLERG